MTLSQTARFVAFALATLLLAVFLTGFWALEWGDFVRLWGDREVLRAVGFGLVTSLLATFLAVLFGVPAGYYLARSRRFTSRLLDAFFDIPLIIPPLIMGVLLLTFFNMAFMKNFYNFVFTTAGAVIAQFFVAFPFTVKTSKSAFEMVSPVYERIAMTLGARPLRSFWDTTLKLASGGIISGILLSWLRALGEFGATLMVGGGIAGKTANIPIRIYLDMTEGDFHKGIAMSLAVALVAFVTIATVRFVWRKSGS